MSIYGVKGYSFTIQPEVLIILLETSCFCETLLSAPPWPFFRKPTLALTDGLELGTYLVTRYTHVKYEGRNSYHSKDKANVKVLADKQ